MAATTKTVGDVRKAMEGLPADMPVKVLRVTNGTTWRIVGFEQIQAGTGPETLVLEAKR